MIAFEKEAADAFEPLEDDSVARAIREVTAHYGELALDVALDAVCLAAGVETTRLFRRDLFGLKELFAEVRLTPAEEDDVYPLIVDGQVVGGVLIEGYSADASLDFDVEIGPYLDDLAAVLANFLREERRQILTQQERCVEDLVIDVPRAALWSKQARIEIGR